MIPLGIYPLCLLRLLLAVIVSQTFLVFDDLQVFHSISLNWDLSCVFLIRLG